MWSRAVRVRAVTVVVVVACSATFAPARAQATITPGELVARFLAARALAEDSLTSPPPERMAQIRAIIGLPATVAYGDTVITIEADPFLARLGGQNASDLEQAGVRLGVLADAATEASSTARADDEAIRRALARSYLGVQTRPGFLQRAQRWVFDRLASFIERLGDLRSLGGIVSWLVVIALLAGVVLILRRLRIVPHREVGRARGRRAQERPDWDALAEAALARGDLREAVRCRFRALVAALDARGLVRESPSLTAAECRRAVSATQPAAREAVDRATRVFERTLYGHATVAPDDVETIREGEMAVRP